MKTQLKLAVVLLLSNLNPQLSTVFAQGSLTPPGAPAPTMKSLAQIEPRIAITNAGAVTISNSGSYYLTTNITVSSGDGIAITTNGVTLDLNGFSISSTASGSGTGIKLSGSRTNIAIRNGFITGSMINNGGTYSGTGFAYGIANAGGLPQNVRVADVGVSGCLNDGIYLNFKSTAVQNCTVATVGGAGISAQSVAESTALNCGAVGIVAVTANNCSGECVGSDDGVRASITQNCQGSSSSGNGVYASTALNCRGSSSSGTGLYASETANTCSGSSSSGTYGLYADIAMSCRGTNSGSSYGLYALSTAENCRGSSSSGTGLYSGETANNCSGYSATGKGLETSVATGCRGKSEAGANGLSAGVALNCYGYASDSYHNGLSADYVATGCVGFGYPGWGVSVHLAHACYVGSGKTNIIDRFDMP